MLAVDTNIVVRYLTADDAIQSPKARSIVDGNDVFVTTSVVLETEWVLRGVYGLKPLAICDLVRQFAGLPTVIVEALSRIALALNWYADGMDFADALHLASSDGCEAFVSFDRALARRAAAAGALPVRAP